jgi:prevent-host-death family protein
MARRGRISGRAGGGLIILHGVEEYLSCHGQFDYHIVMNSHEERIVRVAELKARLSEYLRAARRGQTTTVYDRDTPVARLVPYEGETPPSLPVRKATASLRDVRLPPPLDRDICSGDALAEERQAGR